MDRKFYDATNICIEIMNSKEQVLEGGLGHVVQICVCRLT